MATSRWLLAALLVGCGARSSIDDGRPDAGRRGDAGVRVDGGGARDAGRRADASRSCAEPLEPCGAGVECCAPGSECVDPCGTGGLCSVPGRDTCGCGGFLDECEAPGTSCLFTFCDAPGVCVTVEERVRICEGGAPPCFDCPRCGGELCTGPPPPECAGDRALRRHTEEHVGCEEDRCVYGFETVECGPGERCAGGECLAGGCADCPPGFVCCDASGCDPGRPTRCVPDPRPCAEPVAATGCDGVVYGSACDALAAGVCEGSCEPVPMMSYPYATCADTASPEPIRVVRTREDFARVFTGCSLFGPDLTSSDIVVACHDCACWGQVVVQGVRLCEGGAVVDYAYRTPCTECRACLVRCDAVVVPNLPERVTGNFRLDTCGAECCP